MAQRPICRQKSVVKGIWQSIRCDRFRFPTVRTTIRGPVSYTHLGAVGDILGYFFDAKGDVVTDIKIHNELIGLPLSALKTIPVRVGVAGGENKAEAIAAAMKGGYINALVTDQDTAAAILRS